MNEIRAAMVEILPRLRRFSYALTGDRDLGDDLVQETCMRALSRVQQFQPGTRLDSWMFRIAQNLWVDQARSRKTRGEVVDIDSVTHAGATDGRAVVEGRLTLEAVQSAMRQLPADQQVLIALVCVEGFSYKETADILSVPVGTIMSRLSRARRSLANLVEGGTGASSATVLNMHGGGRT